MRTLSGLAVVFQIAVVMITLLLVMVQPMLLLLKLTHLAFCRLITSVIQIPPDLTAIVADGVFVTPDIAVVPVAIDAVVPNIG